MRLMKSSSTKPILISKPNCNWKMILSFSWGFSGVMLARSWGLKEFKASFKKKTIPTKTLISQATRKIKRKRQIPTESSKLMLVKGTTWKILYFYKIKTRIRIKRMRPPLDLQVIWQALQKIKWTQLWGLLCLQHLQRMSLNPLKFSVKTNLMRMN